MRALPLLLLLAAVAACASTGRSDRGGGPNLLTLEEIQSSDLTNAYDIIETMRPRWLRRRGPTSVYFENPVVVYVDGMRMGGPASLHEIPRLAIQMMRYLSPTEAQARWGMNHTNGAIEVRTGA